MFEKGGASRTKKDGVRWGGRGSLEDAGRLGPVCPVLGGDRAQDHQHSGHGLGCVPTITDGLQMGPS